MNRDDYLEEEWPEESQVEPEPPAEEEVHSAGDNRRDEGNAQGTPLLIFISAGLLQDSFSRVCLQP